MPGIVKSRDGYSPGEAKPVAILFDLYRTLVDITTDERLPCLWDKLAAFLRYRGLPAEARALCDTYFTRATEVQANSKERHPEVDVLSIFGEMLMDLGYRPRTQRAGVDLFCQEVTQLFRVLSTVHLDLYSDTLSTLEALHSRGFRLGVVSDAQRSFLDPEMRILGLAPLFEAVVVSSDLGFHKPDPRLFDKALWQMNRTSKPRISPTQAIYVGDSLDRDVCGAHDAGLRTVLIVRHGATDPTPKAECSPDFAFPSLEAMCTWLGVENRELGRTRAGAKKIP